MQPSLPTSSSNSSIEELRIQNQVLEQRVGNQREYIESLERNSRIGSPKSPELKGLWGRVFGSVAVLVLVVGFARPITALDGNEYLSYGESIRLGYVMGVVDGFDLSYDMQSVDFVWVRQCLRKRTAAQGRTVLEKYYVDHPETRHLTASASLHDALIDACF